MSANIKDLNTSTFDETVAGGETPVLVDFWAPWCGPCKAITPILEELATELDGQVRITKVNVDEAGDIAAKFGIRNIPTLLLFKNGQVVEKIVGLTSKADLTEKITAHA